MKKVLTINAGSSSLKACLFSDNGLTRQDFRYTNVTSMRDAFAQLLSDLGDNLPDVVGHRVVHGGEITDAARLIGRVERRRLSSIVNLAPLHMPANLLGYELCSELFKVPQIACYDTSFHSTIPEINYRLPIPTSMGFRKYGFHGLNYSHVAKQLPYFLGDLSQGKIVIAHLGSGSSLCLLESLKSIDTTMGFTPAGGVVMGSRCGDIDPGVMLALSESYTPKEVETIIFKDSGLLALSYGRSSDMQELCMYPSPDGDFAIESYCSSIRGAIGSMAAKAGGIDAIVFTGGIGENSGMIRCKIMDKLSFLNIKESLIIPADEEKVIYDLCNEYVL